MRNITWKFVTSVHATTAGCPDADGGALIVYQARSLHETAWLEAVESGLQKYPVERKAYQFLVCFQGFFCLDHVGAVNLGIYWKAGGQDLILEGFGAQRSYREWGLYGGQDLRWSHLSHLLVFIPLYVSSHQLWTKVKRWKHVIFTDSY